MFRTGRIGGKGNVATAWEKTVLTSCVSRSTVITAAKACTTSYHVYGCTNELVKPRLINPNKRPETVGTFIAPVMQATVEAPTRPRTKFSVSWPATDVRLWQRLQRLTQSVFNLAMDIEIRIFLPRTTVQLESLWPPAFGAIWKNCVSVVGTYMRGVIHIGLNTWRSEGTAWEQESWVLILYLIWLRYDYLELGT